MKNGNWVDLTSPLDAPTLAVSAHFPIQINDKGCMFFMQSKSLIVHSLRLSAIFLRSIYKQYSVNHMLNRPIITM